VKADQYLLRGFDADHGADMAFFMDGMPINVRSHAHGQGYSDLNFVIHEALQDVEALKGPYDAEYGDFAVAGVVNFLTRDYVEENTAEVSFGTFNRQRYLTLLSPTDYLLSLLTGSYEHGRCAYNTGWRSFQGVLCS
jgi:outer membrane receptor protein involved in Fe transport